MSWLCCCTSASTNSDLREELVLSLDNSKEGAGGSGRAFSDRSTDCASSATLDALDTQSEDDGEQLYDNTKLQLVRRLALRWLHKARETRSSNISCCHRTPSFETDCLLLPEDLAKPSASEPITTERLLGVTLQAVHRALEASESRHPCARFLVDDLNCTNFKSTAWMSSADIPGASVQRNRFEMPLGGDELPEVIARIVNLPKTVSGTSISCMGFDGEVLTMVQQNSAEGVMYSDRFFARVTHRFSADGVDGVLWQQWLKIVWTKPLPWTHGFCRTMIEKSATAQLKSNAPKLKLKLLEAST